MSVGLLGYAMVLVNTLSAASFVLAGAILFGLVRRQPRRHPSRAFLIALLAVELPLFLIGGFDLLASDPYSAGYRGLIVPALMMALIALGWCLNNLEILLWIGLAALLYILRIYDTPNLWDYLVDPFAALLALGWLIAGGLVRLIRRRANRSRPALARDS